MGGGEGRRGGGIDREEEEEEGEREEEDEEEREEASLGTGWCHGRFSWRRFRLWICKLIFMFAHFVP